MSCMTLELKTRSHVLIFCVFCQFIGFVRDQGNSIITYRDIDKLLCVYDIYGQITHWEVNMTCSSVNDFAPIFSENSQFCSKNTKNGFEEES